MSPGSCVFFNKVTKKKRKEKEEQNKTKNENILQKFEIFFFQRENLQQLTQSEPIINKSPKDTPTKSKKNVKEQPKKSVELKEEKKEVAVVANTLQQQAVKEVPKDVKEQPKDTPVKGAKEITKETAPSVQLLSKETKNKKKKNDILAQIGKLIFYDDMIKRK